MAPKYSSATFQDDAAGGHWNVGMNGEAMNEYLTYMPAGMVGQATWIDKADSPEGGFNVVSMTPEQMNAFIDAMPSPAIAAVNGDTSGGNTLDTGGAGDGVASAFSSGMAAASGIKPGPSMAAPTGGGDYSLPGWLIGLGIVGVILIAVAKTK